MVSCIVSQLNILCTSLHCTIPHWKWQFTRHSPFTRYGHCTCSQTYRISSKWSKLCIKTFSTLSGVRSVFWILMQLDILCTSAEKWHYAKNDNSLFKFKCDLFPCIGVHVSKKNLPRSRSDLSLAISYFGELCNKNCIVKSSETLIILSASCCTAGFDKSDAMEGVAHRLLKRVAMVFRVHSRQLNCCCHTDVHSQRWLSIWKELCAINERRGNWYFQCSIVSLNLRKEYLNIPTFKISSYSW